MKIKAELGKTLSRLVSFKSVSSNFKENGRLLDYVEKEVGDNLFVQRLVSNGSPSLIASTRKTNKPKLALVAHGDIVGAPDKLFKPWKEGNKIFGRGTNDMKFAIACYLTLIKDLGEKAKDYDFSIVITSDEELGGSNGIKYLLEKGLRPDVCLLPDGGQNWTIQKSAKGVLNLRVDSFGNSTHGSRPWDGLNAIEQLFDFLTKLRAGFPKEPCGIADHFHNSLNVGKIEGGKAVNQVPDFAQAYLDIRFTEEASRLNIQKELKNITSSYKSIKIEELVRGSSYSLDVNNRYAKLFAKIVKNKIGKEPEYVASHGSSDARYFSEKDIPTILTRPVGGGHHSDREWIDLKDLENFYMVMRDFVEAVA